MNIRAVAILRHRFVPFFNITRGIMNTADLCDAYGDSLQYVEPVFRDYGGVKKFGGECSTVKCHEDNSCVKEVLNQPGNGKVLVVDGGGSLRRALLGDNVAAAAVRNGWCGIIIYGCIRDAEEIGQMTLGVKALATMPRKTLRKNVGEKDVAVDFAGVRFHPGCYVYADVDGIVVSEKELTLSAAKL